MLAFLIIYCVMIAISSWFVIKVRICFKVYIKIYSITIKMWKKISACELVAIQCFNLVKYLNLQKVLELFILVLEVFTFRASSVSFTNRNEHLLLISFYFQ